MTKIVFAVAVTAGAYILYRIFVVLFKQAIRGIFYLIQAVTAVVQEEQTKVNTKDSKNKPKFQ